MAPTEESTRPTWWPAARPPNRRRRGPLARPERVNSPQQRRKALQTAQGFNRKHSWYSDERRANHALITDPARDQLIYHPNLVAGSPPRSRVTVSAKADSA
jgi:hypothetical protein